MLVGCRAGERRSQCVVGAGSGDVTIGSDDVAMCSDDVARCSADVARCNGDITKCRADVEAFTVVGRRGAVGSLRGDV